MKLGINTYTFMWSIGFEGARPKEPLTAMGLLEKARQLGVSLVQLGPNLPIETLSEPELEAFGARAREWGIELELGTRGLETDHLRRHLALCRRLGARLLRTVPEVGGKTPAAADIPACLRAVLPDLERDGIRLGMENGNLPSLALRRALDEVNSPLAGIVLDCVNSLAVPEGWKQVTETLAPYTVCLHYKDFQVKRVWHMMGFLCEGKPAGQGQLDTSWLLETLRAAGATFNVIVELWPPEQKTLAETIALEESWAEASIPYLRRFVRD